jgi:hypothetical protein
MRENKPILLVLSAYDGEIILEKGEILSEKRQGRARVVSDLPSEQVLTRMLSSCPQS